MKRICIINNLPGTLGEYCVEGVAKHYRADYEILLLNALAEPLPGDAAAWALSEGLSAVILDGSLCSPLDDEQWIRDEEEFLRQLVPTGLPVLGICFGHEVMASAFGGKLEVKGPELTVAQWDVEILDRDKLFAGFGAATRQVVAHSVQVVEAPPDFIVTARTPDCPVQAMRHRELPAYSVQFHPEVGSGIITHDPDWRPLTDEQLDNHDGPALLRNFLEIVIKTKS